MMNGVDTAEKNLALVVFLVARAKRGRLLSMSSKN